MSSVQTIVYLCFHFLNILKNVCKLASVLIDVFRSKLLGGTSYLDGDGVMAYLYGVNA